MYNVQKDNKPELGIYMDYTKKLVISRRSSDLQDKIRDEKSLQRSFVIHLDRDSSPPLGVRNDTLIHRALNPN